MKRTMLRIIAMLLAGAAVLLTGAAAETYTFSAGEEIYRIEIPEDYLPYTAEMGFDSPMVKAFEDASPLILDAYMKAMDCSMCCVHAEKRHQTWISVRDRSDGFINVSEDAALSSGDIQTYYDGVSAVRGPYSTETHDGRIFYIFENGRNIFEAGIDYYISTFLERKEVTVHWESGDGTRTEEDTAAVKEMIFSILEEPAEEPAEDTGL